MKAELFLEVLKKQGVTFYTGVPDSLLAPLCIAFLQSENHVTAANEGNAVGLAIGYHLATGELPLVYMQNSGIGNACNPLVSLVAEGVYEIPMILVIGWRGKPGVPDEPQHSVQGRIQSALLDALDIPYVLVEDETACEEYVVKAKETALEKKGPCALIISKGCFEKTEQVQCTRGESSLTREEALSLLLDTVSESMPIVSTTGKTSRELFELREAKGHSHSNDLLCIGGMGHCSSVALGIALQKPEKKVLCIDGDGALLMHLGSSATIAKSAPVNFRHIIMNNKVHESVGGQETAIDAVDVHQLFKSVGYKSIFSVRNAEDLKEVMPAFLEKDGPNLLEICVVPGSRSDLGRPTISPQESKSMFMEKLQS